MLFRAERMVNMANEVQQMTVGVELDLDNFTAKLDAISKALSGIGNVTAKRSAKRKSRI